MLDNPKMNAATTIEHADDGETVRITRRDLRKAQMAAVAAALSFGAGSAFDVVRHAPPARHAWKPKGRNQRLIRR